MNKLQVIKYCRKCGKKLPNGSKKKKCPRCGGTIFEKVIRKPD